jgi:hypothetical protein
LTSDDIIYEKKMALVLKEKIAEKKENRQRKAKERKAKKRLNLKILQTQSKIVKEGEILGAAE